MLLKISTPKLKRYNAKEYSNISEIENSVFGENLILLRKKFLVCTVHMTENFRWSRG